jgi:hypothetical protein
LHLKELQKGSPEIAVNKKVTEGHFRGPSKSAVFKGVMQHQKKKSARKQKMELTLGCAVPQFSYCSTAGGKVKGLDEES